MAVSGFPFRILIVPMMIAVAFLGVATFRQFMKVKSINREIGGLEREINRLENVNTSLVDNLNYYKTLSFLEKEGRVRMGLKANGEKVAVVVPSPKQEDLSADFLFEEEPHEKVFRSNLEKWFYYFFRPDLL